MLWLSEPEVPVTVTVAAPVVAVAEAVNVSTEVALPFAGGVTGLTENPAVTPLGKPVAVKVVAELKLFWLVMVMVLVPLLPWTTVTEAGDAPMVKFGEAAALTVSAKVVLAFRLPEVPLMVTVAVPVVAVLLAVNVLTPGQPVSIIGDTVTWTLVRNSGAAFSMATGYTWVLTLVALGVVFGIIWMGRRLASP